MTTVNSAAELTAALKAAKGGETILLAAGSYGGLTLTGAFASPVTVRPAPGATPRITVLNITGADNLIVEDLVVEIGADPTGNRYVGEVRKTQNTIIRGITFVGNRNVDRSKWVDLPRGLRIYDHSKFVTVEHCDFSFFGRATQVQWIDNLTFRGNRYHDNRGDALFFQCCKRLLIENEHFTDMYRQGEDHADYIQFDSRDGRVCSDVVIRNVVILRGKGNGDVQGIFFGNKTGATGNKVNLPHENVLIENVLYWDTGINGLRLEGGAKNCTVRNVSIIQDVNTWHKNTVGIIMTGANSGSKVENSISNRFSLDAGAAGFGNVTIQFRGDANAADHYSQNFAGPFEPAPVKADALRPKPGSRSAGKGYRFDGSVPSPFPPTDQPPPKGAVVFSAAAPPPGTTYPGFGPLPAWTLETTFHVPDTEKRHTVFAKGGALSLDIVAGALEVVAKSGELGIVILGPKFARGTGPYRVHVSGSAETGLQLYVAGKKVATAAAGGNCFADNNEPVSVGGHVVGDDQKMPYPVSASLHNDVLPSDDIRSTHDAWHTTRFANSEPPPTPGEKEEEVEENEEEIEEGDNETQPEDEEDGIVSWNGRRFHVMVLHVLVPIDE